MTTATLEGGYTYTVDEPACGSYWADRYTPGIPSASQLMLFHVAVNTVDFAAGLQTSQAACITAPDAETVYSVQLDNVEVGTVTFGLGETVGQFAAPADFQAIPGSLLSIVAPSTPDTAQSDVTFTIVGTCANAPPVPETEKLLVGTIKARTVCVGQLTFTPTLVGRVSAGPLEANGRLRVTHDFAIFSNG